MAKCGFITEPILSKSNQNWKQKYEKLQHYFLNKNKFYVQPIKQHHFLFNYFLNILFSFEVLYFRKKSPIVGLKILKSEFFEYFWYLNEFACILDKAINNQQIWILKKSDPKMLNPK